MSTVQLGAGRHHRSQQPRMPAMWKAGRGYAVWPPRHAKYLHYVSVYYLAQRTQVAAFAPFHYMLDALRSLQISGTAARQRLWYF